MLLVDQLESITCLIELPKLLSCCKKNDVLDWGRCNQLTLLRIMVMLCGNGMTEIVLFFLKLQLP